MALHPSTRRAVLREYSRSRDVGSVAVRMHLAIATVRRIVTRRCSWCGQITTTWTCASKWYACAPGTGCGKGLS